jgi:LuxR family quorum sensing-dependent transcriptional regulator
MSSGDASYGREAFEFIEKLDRLSTPEEVMDVMQAVLQPFGFKFFCFNTFPRPQQRFEEVMLAIRVPPEWIKLYLQEQYVHVDPTIRYCRQTTYPFEWKDAPYDAEREPRAAEMVRRATDFGLSEGLWVPIPAATGSKGGVWLGGHRPDLTSRTKPMLHIMALYAFERVRTLLHPASGTKPSLTAREREVLTWTAQGKSAWEIGEILCIAKRTVDEHAQTASRKLGAVNRTQAVALALRDHIIEV